MPKPIHVLNYIKQYAQLSPEVLEVLEQRNQQGIETYGTSLHTQNGRDALQDLVEELADAYMYVTQLRLEHGVGSNLGYMVENALEEAITMQSSPVGIAV